MQFLIFFLFSVLATGKVISVCKICESGIVKDFYLNPFDEEIYEIRDFRALRHASAYVGLQKLRKLVSKCKKMILPTQRICEIVGLNTDRQATFPVSTSLNGELRTIRKAEDLATFMQLR